MNTLETKTSPISKWVESIRIPNRKNNPNYAMARSHNYNHRVEKTKKKIQSLNDAIQPYRWVYHAGDGKIMKANDILDELYKTIGVYQISGKNEKVWCLWRRPRPSGEGMGAFATEFGTEWFDYLGTQSIRESGGYVVVMLSDEGIEFLNKIAKEVLSIGSRTTV